VLQYVGDLEPSHRLLPAGVHALVLDSFTPRGEREICTQRVGMRRITQQQRRRDALGALTTRPWVLLSAAAGPADFQRSLTYAYRAGASGYLCGRAIWQNAFEKFPDMPALEGELTTASAAFVQGINALTDRLATPWMQHPAWHGAVPMVSDGPTFAAQYAGS